jgi:hypothetical protein
MSLRTRIEELEMALVPHLTDEQLERIVAGEDLVTVLSTAPASSNQAEQSEMGE